MRRSPRRLSCISEAVFDVPRLQIRISRLVLLLVCVFSLITPLTQHLWTWDRFMHGGQDFETGLLLILTSVCLIPVLIHACKATVTLLLASWRCLLRLPVTLSLCSSCFDRLQLRSNREIPIGDPPTGMLVPLLI